LSGALDLWIGVDKGVIDGVVICNWEHCPRVSYYHICFLGATGLRKYLPRGLVKIEHYACMLGAKELVMDGRPGFKRLLARYGYGDTTVRLKKNVQKLWSN